MITVRHDLSFDLEAASLGGKELWRWAQSGQRGYYGRRLSAAMDFLGLAGFMKLGTTGWARLAAVLATACFVFPVWGTRQGTVEAGARRPDAWLAAELLAAWEEATNFPTKMRTCENMSQNRVAI